MKKRQFYKQFIGLVCLSLLWGEVSIAEEVAIPVYADPIREQAIADEIRSLREEKLERMPYLDRGFIKGIITEDSVRQRREFMVSGQKSLNTVVERAIDVHTPVIAARERISLSNRRIFGAIRDLFPEMSGQYQHRDGSLGGSGPFNSENYRFTFRQPIFRGGTLWHTVLQEKAELEANKQEYEQVVSDLINDVSAAYFEYNRVLEVAGDQRNAIEKVRRFADISGKKWDEEIISEIEHLNVQSLFSQMQYDYESSKQELELAKLELQKFLNVALEQDLLISSLYSVEEMLERNLVPAEGTSMNKSSYEEDYVYGVQQGSEVPNLEVLVDLAYQNRPELQVETARLQAARLEERIRWGELLPQANFTIEYGKLGEAFNQTPSLPTGSDDPKLRKEYRWFLELSWNALGNQVTYEYENDSRAPTVTQFQGGGAGTHTFRNTVTVGILDGLDALVNQKEAEVEKLDQIVELENAEREVVRDVKESYYDYQRALIQMKSTVKRAAYRTRLAQLSRHRLDKNEIEISEYLQAEIDLLRERTELHQALTDYFTAKAKMNRSVGLRDFMTIEDNYERAI